MALFVSKLVVASPGRPAYALFLVHADGGSVADAIPSEPIDDAVALATIAKKYAGTALACEIDLATVGAPLGYTPGEPPPGTARHRGAAALKVLGAGYGEVDTDTVLELGDACAHFVQREPWKRSTNARRFAARVHVDEAADHDGPRDTVASIAMVVRIMETDDGPGIEITDDGAFEKLLYEGRQTPWAPRPMRLSLWATRPPPCFDAVLAEAFGGPIAPRVVLMLEGQLGPHGELEGLLLAAMLRAVSAGSESARGEAHVGRAVVRAEVDRSRIVTFEPTDPETRLGRREHARASAQALYAAAPEDVAELGIAYLDVRTGVGKLISDLLDRALPPSRDETRKRGVDAHWRGCWLPLDMMAEHFAPYIGPDNARFLLEPVPPRAARVLIITGNSSEVIDVDLEIAQAGRLKAELDELHAAEAMLPQIEADLKAERKGAKPVRPPPFEGTWRDGRAYLPSEIPAEWTVREADERGVVTVDAGDGVTFQLGASRRDGRRLVTVMIVGKDASKPTRATVDPILSRLRGARNFVEMGMFRGEEKMPLPGMRVFAGRLAGDGVS